MKFEETTQTVGGYPVRIYATDGGGPYPIHGAIWIEDISSWKVFQWTNDGYTSVARDQSKYNLGNWMDHKIKRRIDIEQSWTCPQCKSQQVRVRARSHYSYKITCQICKLQGELSLRDCYVDNLTLAAKENSRIEIIKAIHQLTGASLKDARSIVDILCSDKSQKKAYSPDCFAAKPIK